MWYVYRVNVNGALAYIGKGCGRRYLTSARRLSGVAGIIQEFKSEARALREEIRLIAELQPPLNKTKGGEGKSGKHYPQDSDAYWFRKWRSETYKRASHPRAHPVWKLCAAAWAKIELDSEEIRCQQEEPGQERGGRLDLEIARQWNNWTKSSEAALLLSNISSLS